MRKLLYLFLMTIVCVENGEAKMDKMLKTDKEWKQQLNSEQFCILRKSGTERPFTGEYWDNEGKGTYQCAACGLDLFNSDHKFKSGTGWPSFWKPVKEGNIGENRDVSGGMVRIEAVCPRRDSHLGHVFEDGPHPTGLRYCINSGALDFKGKK